MATKKDLIDRVLKRADFLKEEDITYAINSVLDQLSDALTEGNRIEIRGFGSLSTRDRKMIGSDKTYKTTYYRMSKHIHNLLNNVSDAKKNNH